MLKAQVIQSTGSWYEVVDDTGNKYACRLRGRHKLHSKRYTNPVAVGDYVWMEQTKDDDWIIDRVEERERFLVRRSSNLSRKYHVIASNIDQMYLMLTANHPHTPLGFVDRILVMAERARIPATLVMNKMDRYDDDDLDRVAEIEDCYTGAGYQFLTCSLTQKRGLNELQKGMFGKSTLLVGNSGVGKSTLLNILVPDAQQKTNKLSDSYGKGRHTTTFATMFEKDGLKIIDTPGIKEFGLVDITPRELSQYFPEFKKASSECRFNDCMHLKEPDCKVLTLLEKGEIADSRYDAYVFMLDELNS